MNKEEVINFIKNKNIWYESLEHKKVYTMEELEKLKLLVDKWQNEIVSSLEKGNDICIKKIKNDYVVYQNIIKKLK